MSRGYSITCGVFLLALFSGCDSGKPDTTASNAPAENTSPAPEIIMTAEGMKLVMYDDTPDDNQIRKPSFIIDAELGTALTSNGNDNSFKLTRPKAIIFTEDEEEFNLESESGVFDGKMGIATLDGGVKLFSPRLNLTMESIVWNNKSRTGHSNDAIELNSAWGTLHASSMIIHPESGELILTNVSGPITLGASN